VNPSIEAAWIAGSSGFLGVLVGVTGTAVVARIGFKSTRTATDAAVAGGLATVQAQIEADRRSRIWEKRADAYTDLIAVIQHRQDIRQGMWQGIVTGAEPDRPSATVDVRQVEARVIAYASNEVIRASQEAGSAGGRYETEVANWHTYVEQGRMSPDMWRSGPRPDDARKAAEQLHKESDRLDDALTDIIRDELHAGADQPPGPPVPLAPPPPPGPIL
jgi:hypothetical protein